MNDGLLNNWSFSNNTNDSVGTADLYNGVNVFFANDRLNNVNSAMYFARGYYKIPNGVYFSGPFTVSAWVSPKSYQLE